MWELLSYAGRVTEEDVRSLADLCKQCKRESETAVGEWYQVKKRRAQKAKAALRRAKSLQRRREQNKEHIKHSYGYKRQLLGELRNDVLRVTANHCVLEQGRGRLHGDDPDDYLDIGTNQEFSAVVEVLDGPQTRPCTARFKH